MGSLKSKLKEVKSIEDYPHLKNGDEERSDSEINITNKLAFLLSDLNIQRVNKQNHTKNKDWSKYVFVCLHGFPPQENEFEQLNLPG